LKALIKTDLMFWFLAGSFASTALKTAIIFSAKSMSCIISLPTQT